MPAWTRNVPETWANTDGWRTDIALATLQGAAYDVAEFRLANGTRVRIPMKDMRQALSSASVRSNGMVGPFNVNPQERTVNGFRVSMQVMNELGTGAAERQIPTSVTAELLNEDGSFIDFGSFLARYRRPAVSDDNLRTAYRTLRDMQTKSRNLPTAADKDLTVGFLDPDTDINSPRTARAEPDMPNPISVTNTSPPPSRSQRSTPRGEFLKAGGAAVIGGAAALAGTAVTGGMGLSVAGTAVAIGAGPVAIAGAIVGLAGYGLYRAFKG
jgi:hypothetical protein